MSIENPNFENERQPDINFTEGDIIKVKRSNLTIENDWTVDEIVVNQQTGDIRIHVVKPNPEDPEGHRLSKRYSKLITPEDFQELLDLNQ